MIALTRTLEVEVRGRVDKLKKDIRSATQDMGGKVAVGHSGGMGAVASGAAVGEMAGMGKGIKSMVGTLGAIGIGIGIVTKVLEAIQPIIDIMGNILKAILMPLGIMLLNLLKPVLVGMIKLLPLWFEFVQDPAGAFRSIFNSLREKISARLSVIAENLKAKFNELKTWISELPEKIWNYIKELPGKMLDFWVNLPDLIWDKVKGLASMIWDYVKQLLPAPIVRAVEFVSAKVIKVIDGILNMKNGFISKLGEMKDRLVTKLGSLWDSIVALPQQIWDKIKALANLIATKIKNVLPSAPSLRSLKERFIGDAIITPRGEIIHTDPNDTLIATKNGGGSTFNINITLDRREEDVANQIKRELVTELDRHGRF